MTESKKTLKVAVAQSLCLPGDIAGNLARMEPLVAEAAAAGARLILFAESGVTGYTPDSPRIVVGDETYEKLREMARRNGIVVIPGFFEQNGTQVHNTQGVFYPNREVVLQRKARMANVESQIPGFVEGEEKREVFEVDGVRCALAICADSAIPNLHNNLAAAGVHLILQPTAGCGPRHLGYTEASLDDPEIFEKYLKSAESVVFSAGSIRHCRLHRIAMVCCNQMADNGVDYFHPGHSMIVDASGELVGLIPGSFVFEHLRPRLAVGEIRPQTPRLA